MDDKTLDHIFKTAFNTKGKNSQEEGDWDDFEQKLKKRLKKRGFFFFTWNRFNIYYVGLLMAAVISGGYIYCQNYVWNTSTDSNLNTDRLSVDTSSVRSSARSEERNTFSNTKLPKETNPDVNKSTKPTESITTNTSSTLSSRTDSTTRLMPQVNVKDSASSSKEETATPGSITPPTAPIVVMRRKKTVVVITAPSDTIIKIDTVKVKKGKKK